MSTRSAPELGQPRSRDDEVRVVNLDNGDNDAPRSPSTVDAVKEYYAQVRGFERDSKWKTQLHQPDRDLRLEACCCPCVVWNRTRRQLDQLSEGKRADSSAASPCSWSCIGCCVLGICTCGGSCCLQIAFQRSTVREEYGIKGTCGNDCQNSTCSPCLALAQHEAEILARSREAAGVVKQQPKPEPPMSTAASGRFNRRSSAASQRAKRARRRPTEPIVEEPSSEDHPPMQVVPPRPSLDDISHQNLEDNLRATPEETSQSQDTALPAPDLDEDLTLYDSPVLVPQDAQSPADGDDAEPQSLRAEAQFLTPVLSPHVHFLEADATAPRALSPSAHRVDEDVAVQAASPAQEHRLSQDATVATQRGPAGHDIYADAMERATTTAESHHLEADPQALANRSPSPHTIQDDVALRSQQSPSVHRLSQDATTVTGRLHPNAHRLWNDPTTRVVSPARSAGHHLSMDPIHVDRSPSPGLHDIQEDQRSSQ